MVTGWPVAIFPIVFGVLYLDMALQKALWKNYGWLEGWLRQGIAHPTFGWYTAFLRDVVFPHFEVFGMLTFATEMALGVAFVSGTLTGFAGVAGALWQLNIAAGAFSVPGEWYWVWPLLILPQLVFAASGAGRILGGDAALRRIGGDTPPRAWLLVRRVMT